MIHTLITEQGERLRALWQATINGVCPELRQFNTWLLMHGRDETFVEWGIRELAYKLQRRAMDDEYKVRFMSSIMNAERRKRTQEKQR
jgi:ribosomal protein S6